MNVIWLVLQIMAAVLLLAGFVISFVFFILFLIKLLTGAKGGWRRLTEFYATANPLTGQITKRQTIQVGAVTYRRCATLGVADEGLYVAIWRTTVLIPWTEFKVVGRATLQWKSVMKRMVGNPPVVTMMVPMAVFQVMRGNLPTGSA